MQTAHVNRSKHLVVLTRARMSTECRPRTFERKGDSIWNDLDSLQVEILESKRRDREHVLQFYNMRQHQLFNAQPSYAIVDLDRMFRASIITS